MRNFKCMYLTRILYPVMSILQFRSNSKHLYPRFHTAGLLKCVHSADCDTISLNIYPSIHCLF